MAQLLVSVMLLLFVVSVAPSAGAQWETVESMTAPREAAASAVLGGCWYVAGGSGRDPVAFPPAIEVYDPGASHWQELGSVAEGRSGLTAEALPAAGEVAFLGGTYLQHGLPEASNEADIWDGVERRDSTMLHARWGHASAAGMGTLVVAGGWTPGAVLDEVEVLRPDDGWRMVDPVPGGARAYHTMTTLADGAHVLLAGGCSAGSATNSSDLFDVASGTWRITSAMLEARCGHRAALLSDGRVLVTGGMAGSQALASCEIYDPTIGRWTQAAPMVSARYRHTMGVLADGRVVVAGGSDNGPDPPIGAANSAEVYHPAEDRWSPLPPMHAARWFATSAVLGDRFYVAGGSNTEGPLATVERLILPEPSPKPLSDQAHIGGSCVCSARPRGTTMGWLARSLPLPILIGLRRVQRRSS